MSGSVWKGPCRRTDGPLKTGEPKFILRPSRRTRDTRTPTRIPTAGVTPH